MAHITLIRPPAVTTLGNYSLDLIPPIGLAYVAAAMEAAGHRVTLIDALGEAPEARRPAAYPGLFAWGLSIEEVIDRIPRGTQGIGVSTMFSQQWPHVEALVRAIAQHRPEVPIFLGGEHATATWQYLLDRCPEISICVLGEGEGTARDVADWIDGRLSLDEIPGVAFRKDGSPRRNERRARLTEPAAVPWPAWHLVPVEQYLSRGLGHGVDRGRSMPLLATRGCPFQCTFCSSPEMWTTRYDVRPVEDVVDEIEAYIARYRITNVDFVDLTVIIKRDWTLNFCRELERRQVRITYQLPSGTRSEALDREVLEALYRTGCRNITYAPESGSPRTLQRIKKRIRLDRVLDSMRAAHEVGMIARANMIVGFPFETRSDMWQTLYFCLRMAWMGVEDIALFSFTPYPGSEIFDDLQREGMIAEMNNSYFAALGLTDLTKASNLCRQVSAAEINFYRLLGMGLTVVVGYARHPSRCVRTTRHVLRGDSESAFEKRINLLVRRPVLRFLKRRFARRSPRQVQSRAAAG
jgi:anaerobic magnesium-protoporphyrin IX monomethyl ester cyclase